MPEQLLEPGAGTSCTQRQSKPDLLLGGNAATGLPPSQTTGREQKALGEELAPLLFLGQCAPSDTPGLTMEHSGVDLDAQNPGMCDCSDLHPQR